MSTLILNIPCVVKLLIVASDESSLSSMELSGISSALSAKMSLKVKCNFSLSYLLKHCTSIRNQQENTYTVLL